MKSMIKSIVAALAGIGIMAGGAMAIPLGSLPGGWVVSDSMDYWTVTDMTTGQDGDSFFKIVLEHAAYESGFGLYTVDDLGQVESKFEIFRPTAEPSSSWFDLSGTANVNFWNDNGDWKITTTYSNDGNLDNDGWVDFAHEFGFYYDVDRGANGTIDYTFFTDSSLNTAEPGEEHILTVYNADWHSAYILLDDQIGSGDADFNDMTVFVNDVQPVPEPATMLLFGTGMAALAGTARRKMARK